jgi:hypothetical protein
MARGLQNPRFQLRGQYRGDLADMPAVQSRDALLSEALAPAGHETAAALDPLGGFIPRMAFGQQQDQPGSSGVFRPIRPAGRAPRQFHTLRIRQGDGVCHGRHCSL